LKLEGFLKFLINYTPSSEIALNYGENYFLTTFVYTPTIKFERLFIAKSCKATFVIDLIICNMNKDAAGAIFAICSPLIFYRTS